MENSGAKSSGQSYSKNFLVNSTKKDLESYQGDVLSKAIQLFIIIPPFILRWMVRSIQDQLLKIYPQKYLGLSLTIPIFNNFQIRLDVSRSRVLYKNQELQKLNRSKIVYQRRAIATHQNYQAAVAKQANTGVQSDGCTEAQLLPSQNDF